MRVLLRRYGFAVAYLAGVVAAGAEAADVMYIGDRSSGVQVRKGELEDVHRSEGEQMGLRVFIGTKSASVASSRSASSRSSRGS